LCQRRLDIAFFMLYSSISPHGEEIASVVHFGIDASKRGSCGQDAQAISLEWAISILGPISGEL
jgi:hypothetical protein